jgi:hypothetical protein
MATCQQLRIKLQEIKSLKNEFDLEVGMINRQKGLEKLKELKRELLKKIESLEMDLFPDRIEIIWANPETGEKKEISLDINQQIEQWKSFYDKYTILMPDENSIKECWRRNHKKIKKEMENYGYDYLLIVPADLPDTQTLNELMCGEYAETLQSDGFKHAGGLRGAKHVLNLDSRIVLTKEVQNFKEDPLFRQTSGKGISDLSGFPRETVLDAIKCRMGAIPIDFEAEINNKRIKIYARGLSLNEYLIFQRQYFEKSGLHLDDKYRTLITESFIELEMLEVGWNASFGGLVVAISSGDIGCRFTRSFSI